MSAPIHHLYRQPTEERSRLITALDRIKANQERPRLAVVTGEFVPVEYRPKDYWRRRYNAFLRGQRQMTCGVCKGTGEISVWGDRFEYEPPDPCPRCQRTAFEARIPLDDVPF